VHRERCADHGGTPGLLLGSAQQAANPIFHSAPPCFSKFFNCNAIQKQKVGVEKRFIVPCQVPAGLKLRDDLPQNLHYPIANENHYHLVYAANENHSH
jgi:hypothetical protein